MRVRPFRNADPPALTAVWNESLRTRGAVELRNASAWDAPVLSKPYFDRGGLLVAEEGDGDERRVIGFIHVGFGPSIDFNRLDHSVAVICAVIVRPDCRRRGVGRELVRQAELFAKQAGAVEIQAGSQRPLKPFYLGIYGGSNAAGFLTGEEIAEPFFRACGYHPNHKIGVFQRLLEGPLTFVDPRFGQLQRRYEAQTVPSARLGNWWRECTVGNLDPQEFRLDDKRSGQTAARTLFWEMKEYGWRWGMPCAGIIDVQVRNDLRRQGLGKYAVAQLLRYLQEQFFAVVEVQVPEEDEATARMFRSLGFNQIDTGSSYRRSLVE